MVVEVDSYNLILGIDWLTKAKAIVDLGARKMKIIWKERSLTIPIDTERGILPELKDEESQGGYYMTQFTQGENKRGLTRQEREELVIQIMKEARCNLYETRVYCAEMMYTCASIWKVNYGSNWKSQYSIKQPRRYQAPMPKYTLPTWTWK